MSPDQKNKQLAETQLSYLEELDHSKGFAWFMDHLDKEIKVQDEKIHDLSITAEERTAALKIWKTLMDLRCWPAEIRKMATDALTIKV